MTDVLPILTRRRIEAEFARGVYEVMKAELGEATAKRILAEAVVKMAREGAAQMAREAPGGAPDLDSFRALQPLWTAEDALVTEVVEFHPNHLPLQRHALPLRRRCTARWGWPSWVRCCRATATAPSARATTRS